MTAPVRNGYSATQIAIHWIIAVLVVLQFAFRESMEEAWDAFKERGDPSLGGSLVVQAHVWGGLAVLAFALWRLWLRQTRGVPAAPSEEPAPLRLAAHVTHVTLYALMLAMPLSGAATWFGGLWVAEELHGLLVVPLFFLVILHVLGSLFQHFYLKTNVLKRIVSPES